MSPEELVGLLRELVELESPTEDSEGIRTLGARVSTELEALGGDVRSVGDHLRADFEGEGQPLLVLGHLDTVWPRGTLARLPFRIEGDRAYGPGVYDMKAGIVILLAALSETGPRRRALRIFLTADEEAGSPTGKPLIEEAAAGVSAALVVEPALPDGGLKTARKGLGRFRLEISGVAAHSGTNAGQGASAIVELARQVLRLEALNDESRGISVNVGVVAGGTRDNVVAAEASAQIDVRIASAADVAPLELALRTLEPALEETSLSLSGGWTRPPLERSDSSAALFARAREHGQALSLDLREGSSGGGSDGNLVGALGIPVLDGLGPLGGGAHGDDEHVLLDSLPSRVALLARLLADPQL